MTLLKAIGSSASAHVSIEYGIKGPTFGVVSACATATHAIGLTYRMIREGLVDFGIAGAAEASLNWGATRAWQAMRVLSLDGLFPFAKRRNGTVLAEGAGIDVLEECRVDLVPASELADRLGQVVAHGAFGEVQPAGDVGARLAVGRRGAAPAARDRSADRPRTTPRRPARDRRRAAAAVHAADRIGELMRRRVLEQVAAAPASSARRR